MACRTTVSRLGDIDVTATATDAANSSGEETMILSVIVPFYDYDIARLFKELVEQVKADALEIELIFGDDGSKDTSVYESLLASLEDVKEHCVAIRFEKNIGRARIRNVLAEYARGRRLLFLDCDMLPDSVKFLSIYVEQCKNNWDVICGGRSYQRLLECPANKKLYLYLSKKTECLSAEKRNKEPYRYLFTNNLVVRREIFDVTKLDETFRGWGWEDVEWGIRAAKRHSIVHIDNTATHMGVVTDKEIIEKNKQAAPNFIRLFRLHPRETSEFPVYRYSLVVARFPLQSAITAILEKIAVLTFLPLSLRYACLQILKAFYIAMLLDNSVR